MRDQKICILDALAATCPCGALPYDPKKHPAGRIGLTRHRKSRYAQDGGWSVVCTQCGRVGERDSTQIGAVDKWVLRRYLYGPLKEDTL